jgi:hypothetical protein
MDFAAEHRLPQTSLDFAQLNKLVTAAQHSSFRLDGFSV